MTEQELRAIVRDAVARRLGQSLVPGPGSAVRSESRVPGPADDRRSTIDDRPSHAVYVNLLNVGGECVVEPSVPCNHCNYCKSHGH